MTHASFVVTVEPTIEPITLAEMKRRLRITAEDFDQELADLIVGGRLAVEYDTNRKLINQTVAMYLDDFPVEETMEVRLAPISTSVITYTDSDGAAQTFAAAKYNTDFDSTPPRIKVVDGVFWPSVDDVPNAVTVTMTAGYGATASTVPITAKLAVVEWCRAEWADGCGADSRKYRDLINQLAWTAIGKAA